MKILLATDAQKASDGAVRLAAMLQQKLGATVEAQTVVEPPPMVGEGVALSAFPTAASSEGRGTALRKALEEYLHGFGAPAADWPTTVEIGLLPHTIVRRAKEGSFSHIVLGLGRHKLVDRWLGTETALRVMQLSHIPVLAVPEEGGSIPSRIVVAVDFSDFSRRAIERALEICGPESQFDLVHVAWISPGDNRSFEDAEWHERLHEQVRQELADWAAAIPGLAAHQTELHVPAGKPADEVLRVAEDVGADLITAGTHGRGFLGRTVFGSVAKLLVRRAQTQLLIAPPAEMAADVAGFTDGDKASPRN